MKVLVYNNPETGHLSVMYPNQWLTIEQCKERVPDGVTSYEIDSSELPANRNFRDAWVYSE